MTSRNGLRRSSPTGAARVWLALTLVAGLDACATARAPRFDTLASVVRCADIEFPIYFDRGSDHLTPAARLVLANAVGEARGCMIVSTEVVGLTPPDPAPADLALSKLRAEDVAKAMTIAGLPAPAAEVIETRAARSRVRIARQSARVLIHLHP